MKGTWELLPGEPPRIILRVDLADAAANAEALAWVKKQFPTAEKVHEVGLDSETGGLYAVVDAFAGIRARVELAPVVTEPG
jgi:hypothetical protein